MRHPLVALVVVGFLSTTVGAAPAQAGTAARAGLVQPPVKVHDIAYDTVRDRLYASVQPSDGRRARQVVALDPRTGAVLDAVSVGDDPGVLAVSGDQSVLYVGLRNTSAMVRVDLDTFEVDRTIPLRSANPSYHDGPVRVMDLEVKPDDPDVVLASLTDPASSPGLTGIAVIDDGTQLPAVTEPHTGPWMLTSGPDATTFYGHDGTSGLYRLRVADDGVHATLIARVDDVRLGSAVSFDHVDGRLYWGGGAIDPRTGAVVGHYTDGGVMAPSPWVDLLWVLRHDGLDLYDRSDFVRLDRMGLELPDLWIKALIPTRTGLAGFDAGSRLFLFSPSTNEPVRNFSDIAGHTHARGIVAAAGASVAAGYPDGTFRPDRPVTRGQMASLLVRALRFPASSADPFSDVAGDTHAASIRALAAAGVTSGYRDGTYRPDAPVSREQMATFLVRAFDLPATDMHAPFDDIDGEHAFSIDDLYAAGITGGTGPWTYSPSAPVRRGQMATFLARSLDLVERVVVVYP